VNVAQPSPHQEGLAGLLGTRVSAFSQGGVLSDLVGCNWRNTGLGTESSADSLSALHAIRCNPLWAID